MGNLELSDDVFQKINEGLPKLATPQQFLEVFGSVLNNPTLAGILGQGDEELKEKIQKITYAKIILPPNIFAEVGEELITARGMTLDKLCTIGVGAPETLGLMDGGLSIDQVQAMTGEWLAYPDMTVDKITLLGFGATPEIIQNIGPENIAKMPKSELNKAITDIQNTIKKGIKEDYQWLLERFPEGLLGQEKSVLILIDGYEMLIQVFEPTIKQNTSKISIKKMSFGLFLQNQETSRKTIIIGETGSTMDEPNLVIPEHDITDNEPIFSSSNREIITLVVEKLRKEFPNN